MFKMLISKIVRFYSYKALRLTFLKFLGRIFLGTCTKEPQHPLHMLQFWPNYVSVYIYAFIVYYLYFFLTF